MRTRRAGAPERPRPLGDPLMLVLGDQEYTLSVRASEAATILLKE
ncbi:hypothetical protein ACFQT0_03050 [Hymenobacter humi]|uniref:Ferrous iron transport protein A n=1 Tax=Hymenobacter humi TaxID=1411620 RepID=A0ABW2TZG2_9BACT